MKIEIHLQNGIKLTATIENYDAMEFAKQINARDTTVVVIGDYIFSKHLLAYVGPVPEAGE